MLTTVSIFNSEEIKDYHILNFMCVSAKNIRNSALYMIRQHFFATGKFLGFNELDKLYKKEHAALYYQNNSWVSQNMLKNVSDEFSSFFALLALKNSGQYTAKVKIPKYQKDSGLRRVKFAGPSLKILRKRKNQIRTLRLSLSKILVKKFGKKYLEIKIPKNINGKIKQVEIVPLGNKNFQVHFTYEEKKLKKVKKPEEKAPEKLLSIDLGVNNLCAMIDSEGKQLLINGKVLKNYNQLYNKEVSKLQSKCDLEKNKWKKRKIKDKIKLVTKKRNKRVKDYLHKVSCAIVAYAVANNINKIIIGKNDGWKQNINIGVKNNQTFTNIPHAKLIEYISYKALRHGIVTDTINEAHTSKCDALAKEPVCHQNSYLGKRIKRGLFSSSTGIILNADINGALNIMRKHSPCIGDGVVNLLLSSGCLVLHPRHLAFGTYGCLKPILTSSTLE